MLTCSFLGFLLIYTRASPRFDAAHAPLGGLNASGEFL